MPPALYFLFRPWDEAGFAWSFGRIDGGPQAVDCESTEGEEGEEKRDREEGETRKRRRGRGRRRRAAPAYPPLTRMSLRTAVFVLPLDIPMKSG
eukprot:242547-Hanusia_phi.AAC.3